MMKGKQSAPPLKSQCSCGAAAGGLWELCPEIINVNFLVPKGHKLSHFSTKPCVLCCSKSLLIHQVWLELSCADLQECTKNSLALAASRACEESLCILCQEQGSQHAGGEAGKAKSVCWGCLHVELSLGMVGPAAGTAGGAEPRVWEHPGH